MEKVMRNRRIWVFVLLGAVLVLGTMLFPPWVVYTRGPGLSTELPYGRGFLFTTETPESPSIALRVDFAKLALEWLVIVILVVGAAWLDNRMRRRR